MELRHPDEVPEIEEQPRRHRDKEKDEETTGAHLARPEEIRPTTLHLLPLWDRPFFPAQGMPLILKEDPWLETVEKAAATAHKLVGVVLLRRDVAGIPEASDFHAMGTAVRVHDLARMDGAVRFIAEGVDRFRIVEWISREPPYLARVEYPQPPAEDSDRLKAYGMAVINTFKELIPLSPLYSEELRVFLSRFGPAEPSPFADFAANLTTADKADLQEVLETVPLIARMEKVLLLLKKELDVAKIQAEIRKGVQERVGEQQRRFFLREQMKEIQKELGISKDDKTAELERFQERLEGLDVPEHAKKRIDEEMEKLGVLDVGSPEYGVTRNYLDWMTALPWSKYSHDRLDLDRAREILDRDHDGLEDVKDRIIEFLAVGAYKGEIAGSILLLVGPPGVGKTSVGRSVAEALERKFYRFSLGGMRDEAEIKGHRRTYIGAMPGKFIQAIKEMEVANPVIMLDEVDKIGASFRGDPASALLEVLDPEQNVDFLDHYLDVRFDLSKVLFMCTANQLDTIPRPLLDRMEAIHLPGYITREKLAIARNHLWPKQLDKAGVPPERIQIGDDALEKLVEGYAREAGVRDLEKHLGRIIRKAVIELLKDGDQAITVDEAALEKYLGKAKFRKEHPLTGVGIVTGLAWTPLGGVTLNVEASRIHERQRGFTLTGQLGDVMKESATIASSYVQAHATGLAVDPAFFAEATIHLHVPEGATPKDGPSAGVTMATALVSLARHQAIARPLAMTGELTLTGKVLPVGGIREKVIAARRNEVRELILPEDNKPDFEDLPDYLREGLTVHFVADYPQVAQIAFGDGTAS